MNRSEFLKKVIKESLYKNHSVNYGAKINIMIEHLIYEIVANDLVRLDGEIEVTDASYFPQMAEGAAKMLGERLINE